MALGTEKQWLASTASFTFRADRLAHRRDPLGVELQVAQPDLHLDGLEAVVLELERFLDASSIRRFMSMK